jgi:hypothetical protein
LAGSSSARVTIPISLAAELAMPHLPQRFWAAAALWLAPMIYWILLPVEGGLQNLIVQQL